VSTQVDTIFNNLYVATCIRSLICLVASALVLLGIYYQIEQPGGGYAASDTRVDIPLIQLQAIIGEAQLTENEELAIKLVERDNRYLAFVATAIKLPAADYPILEYSMAGLSRNMRLAVNWRTAEAPNELNEIANHWSPNETRIVNLARDPGWRGTITALAIQVEASDGSGTPVIKSLKLLPRSFEAAVLNTVRGWQVFRAWDVRSLGYVLGTVDPNTPSPVIAAAAWAGLALVIALLWGAVTGLHFPASHAIVLAIPWLIIDLNWQNNLDLQVEVSKSQYQGKTDAEKHAASPDAYIHRYTTHLKENILPEPPARIFILDETFTRSYARIKTHYFLLPHRIYNYGSAPPKHGIFPGDYILVFKGGEFLQFDEKSGHLRWGENQSLPAALLDESFWASTYQVLPSLSKGGRTE
jgi:hypothetical protein